MKPDSRQTPPAGHFTTLNGFEMYYEVYGEGYPLVLLHAFTGSTVDWQPYLTELARHFQVIVPDLRGQGRSTNPTKQFTHRQAALDVFALLDQLKIQQVKLIGRSSGGHMSLHMATQQPTRVEAMVLVSAASYFPESGRASMRQFTLTSAGWDALRQKHIQGDEQIRDLIDQVRGFADNYDDMNFTPPYLSTITARTLIVHGDRDLLPVSVAVEMYMSIPNSYLWVVPNGEHIPIQGERAKPFTQAALAFLRGEWE